MVLQSPVTDIKGVGAEVAKKLAVLGVKNIRQLIDYYPRRYDDYSQLVPINLTKPGPVSVKGTIKQAVGRYARRGLHITEAVVSDETGSLRLVWFNQPYRAASLKVGEQYYISGEFGLSYQRLSILNPSVELVSSFPVNTARIVPIYRETKGLKSTQIRKALRETLSLLRSLPETLPSWLVAEERLISRAEAVEQIHFPSSPEDLLIARRRLGFEEVFELTLAALLNKYELLKEEALIIPFDEKLARKFVSHLPFELTDDQRRVVWQIYQDMGKSQPMNRLVEGDVGSGKTVVAAMAALMAISDGFQVALMAPTELLARQHANTIFNLLKPLGMSQQVGLLVGGLKATQKTEVQKRIAGGDVRFMVGTNALIQEKVDMHRLGLVIIDEQHRFGVDQRRELMRKTIPKSLHLGAAQGASEKRPEAYKKYAEDASQLSNAAKSQKQQLSAGSASAEAAEVRSLGGHMPHVLSMTATPIPRSLALTLYGELDISVISHKPANRLAIKTDLISMAGRPKLYSTIDAELAKGRQAFVVCPLITESDFMPGKSAEQVYQELSTGPFKHRRVGLLHGKLKPVEKNAIMQAFVRRDLDVLVSTTVIEVGVDVPNAMVMIVENAERFGLAQLHQLRGRVGRSEYQGYCYLVLGDSQSPSKRLRALEQSADGFKLAEYDLELRGPGAIYGTMQHGQLDLRIAKLSDTRLIASARKRAQEFIDKRENLLKYKELHENVKRNRAVTNLN